MKKGLLSLVFALSAVAGFGQCNPVNGINENFDTWEEIDECWTGIGNGGMFLVGGDVTFYTFMNPDVSMYLISPEIVEGEYNLTFDFATSSMDGSEVEGITVEVGTVTSNENADSFVSVSDPIATTVAVQSFSTPLSISGDVKYFAIKVHGTAPHSAALIDNLVLTPNLAINDIDAVKVSVYPNPVVNKLNITAKEMIKEVKIFSMNGQLIQTAKFDNNLAVVNMSALKAGVYVAQVVTAKGTQTVKVVKK